MCYLTVDIKHKIPFNILTEKYFMKFLIIFCLFLFYAKALSQDSKLGFSAEEIKETCPYLIWKAQSFSCHEKQDLEFMMCKQALPEEEPPEPINNSIIHTVEVLLTFCNPTLTDMIDCFPEETAEECLIRRQNTKRCTIHALQLASKSLCLHSFQ